MNYKLLDLIRDAIALAGAGLFCYGVWLIYPPLAALAGGAILVLISIYLKKEMKNGTY